MSRLPARLSTWSWIILSTLLLTFAPPAFSQIADDLPKTENITVSAAVMDNIPPTTPVLISPEDNSSITTGFVTFIWKGSSDENGIKEYELLIDGAVFITDIPPNDAQTNRFTLTYDPLTDYYALRTKELITDGTHTWKIIAIDTLENGTDSATWTFTVDTQAPAFILSQVGEVPTSISAQDINTVPDVPIELDENQPQLLGNGEANSTVSLVVTIPGDPIQLLINTTDINGNWGEILGILPRNTTVVMDFTITDQAGLISVINNVKLIIKSQVFVFPPLSPSPSPSPVPSPVPGASPLPSLPPTSPPPYSPPPTPLIAIPLTPPIEIAHEIIQETVERLPAPVQKLIAQVPTEKISTFLPWSALLILLLMGFFALVAMIKRFGKDLSPRVIWSTLQALGLFPHGKPQGLVYDSQTHSPIPFALVEIRSEDNKIVDLAVTDKNGVYRGIILEPGKYQAMISHPDYQFPTHQLRPAYLTIREFYLGELFEINDQYLDKNQMLYLIPIDLATEQPQNNPQPGGALKTFNRFSSSLFYPLLITNIILTVIFPSFWNIVVLGCYLIQAYYRSSTKIRKPNLSGVVIDQAGNKTKNAILAAVNPKLNQFEALVQSQVDGSFKANLAHQSLLLAITKPGYIWVEKDTPITGYTLDASQENKHLVVTLKPAANS